MYLLLNWFQAEDEEGTRLTDEELWEDVHDIMGAGHETTATTTAAVLYCVSAHPPVAARVRAELAEVVGPGEDARAQQTSDVLCRLSAMPAM